MQKTLIAGLAAVAALTAAAAPAVAQPYRGHDRGDYGRVWDRGDYDINRRQQQLDRFIDAGIQAGSITRREANELRNEFRDIARLEGRYRVNGLSGRERADLDRRFDRLEAQIRQARTDNDRRYGYGYGYRR